VLLPVLTVTGILGGLALNRSGISGGILLSSVFLLPLLSRRLKGRFTRGMATGLGLLCTAAVSYVSLSSLLSIIAAATFTWSDGLRRRSLRRGFASALVASLFALVYVLTPLVRDTAAAFAAAENATIFTGSLSSFQKNPIEYSRFKVLDRAFLYFGAIREIQSAPLKIEGGRAYPAANLFMGGADVAWPNYAHNFPLEVFIEFGLLTGLPFIYLAVRAYKILWRGLARRDDLDTPETLFLASFALSLTPWLIFYNYALVPNQGFVLWLCTGLVARNQYSRIRHLSTSQPALGLTRAP
jgi:hypothetical protein